MRFELDIIFGGGTSTSAPFNMVCSSLAACSARCDANLGDEISMLELIQNAKHISSAGDHSLSFEAFPGPRHAYPYALFTEIGQRLDAFAMWLAAL
jgi:hypothetical protein